MPAYPDQPGLDYCPNCNLVFEIAAVDLSIISGNIVLFVCPNCGLTKAENRTETRRKLRVRIAELDRLIRRLKTRRYGVKERKGITPYRCEHPDRDR